MDAAVKTKQLSERNLRAEHYWVRSLYAKRDLTPYMLSIKLGIASQTTIGQSSAKMVLNPASKGIMKH